MAPSRQDKSRTTAGVGMVTSFLLSSHNPLYTPAMGLGRFFGSSTSSSSSSRSPQPRGRNPPPMGPGSSKLDYARGLDSPTSPSTSLGLAHSYYHDDDAPPAYSPQKSSDFHDYATDTKMSTPGKTNTNAAHFSVPAPVDPGPIDSRGESPLKALSNRDIVVLLDDSGSMLIVDPVANRTRWDQVSSYPLTPARALAVIMVRSNKYFYLNSRHGTLSAR